MDSRVPSRGRPLCSTIDQAVRRGGDRRNKVLCGIANERGGVAIGANVYIQGDIDHSSSAIAIAKSPFKKMWLCRNLILARTLIGGDSTAE